MILFFDLDGPILDVSPRYFVLHRELLAKHGVKPLDDAAYWAAKRARRSEEAILAEIGASHLAAEYVDMRLSVIETAAFLRHDRVWPWAIPCLTALEERCPLVMVTARSDRTALLGQLDARDLRKHFDEILSEPGGPRVDLQKAALINDYLRRHRRAASGSWMIGDTEADIDAGKHVGLRTVGVLSGIRDEVHLRRAEPDLLLPNIADLPNLLTLPPSNS